MKGKASEGILSPVGWALSADYPGNKEFVEAHKKKFGKDPSEDQANGYTVGQVVKAAVDAVGCVDPTKECQKKLADHIRQGKFDTVVGPLSFDDNGRPEQAHMIQQYINGKVEIVLPKDSKAKTADLVFPKPAW